MVIVFIIAGQSVKYLHFIAKYLEKTTKVPINVVLIDFLLEHICQFTNINVNLAGTNTKLCKNLAIRP